MLRMKLDRVRCRVLPSSHRRTRRLNTELLEPRQLLATVSLNTDLGVAGELRTAIASAVPGETITFALAAGNESIVLTQGALQINKNLTIDGANAGGSGVAVTVNGNSASRVVHVDDGDNVINTINVSLRNMTITGGSAAEGAGIANAEVLALNNVTVRDNFAQQTNSAFGTFGGGILNSGRLTITNSRVEDNVAQFAANGANSAFGGGIASSGVGAELTIIGSSVSGNEAVGGTGGGIFTRLSSLTIQDSSIDNNRAGLDLTVLQVQRYDAGGGIAAFSEGSGNFAAVDITITNSSISGNLLSNDTFTDLTFPYGGGFYVRGRGNVEISDSNISGNTATGSNAAGPNVISRGGGMFIYGDDGGELHVNIRRSTIDGNDSITQGGAMGVRGRNTNNGNPLDDGPVFFTIENSTISNNTSGTQGGAVWNWSHNSALPDITNLHIKNSTLTGNSSAAGRSGVIHNRSGANLILENSTVSGNSAGTSGGAISNLGYGLSSGQQRTKAIIRNSTFSNNTAANNGGAIYSYDGDLELFQSTVSGNNATTGVGGGVYLKTDSSYVGGPMEGISTIERSTITLNNAALGGGGIAVDYYHKSDWQNSIVSGNLSIAGLEDISLGYNTTVTYDFTLIGGNAMLGPLQPNGGPTWTHLPAAGSPVINAADPTATGTADQRGFSPRVVGSAMDMGSVEVGAAPSCDFNGSGTCDITDIDMLITEIAGGGTNLAFDLTGDGQVNLNDRDAWLAAAGAANLPCGNAYTMADFNLDGVTDGTDFGLFNANKFTNTALWSKGDANADGVTDGSDFGIFNANKFTSACVLNRELGNDLASSTLPQRNPLARHAFPNGQLEDDVQARNGGQVASQALQQGSGSQRTVTVNLPYRGQTMSPLDGKTNRTVVAEPSETVRTSAGPTVQFSQRVAEDHAIKAIRSNDQTRFERDRDLVFANWWE